MDAARDIAIDATGVADWRLNGADVPKPPTDHGSTRYSAESAPEFAANVTQPESLAGSMELYAPTARVSWVPCAPQDAKWGPAASLLLHALAKTAPMKASAVIRVFRFTLELRRYRRDQ